MKLVNLSFVVALVILTFYLLIVGQQVLIPFVIALVFWFLINLLSQTLQRLKIGSRNLPGWLSLSLSLLAFLFIFWLIGQLISMNINDVVLVAPIYQANFEARMVDFLAFFRIEEALTLSQLPEMVNLRDIILAIASSLTGIIASSGIVLIYLLFLFLEQGTIDKKIAALVADEKKEVRIRQLLKKINGDVRKYIGIKMLTSSLTGVLSYIFLIAVGVDFAGFWALLIFLLNFIPTIGSIIATIFPALITLVQFDNLTPFFLVAGGVTAIQVVIGNILEPRLMGNSLNLSPVIILLNLSLWGLIWGIPGMFLCVPFLVIGMIVFSHIPQTRVIAVILSRDGQVSTLGD